MRRVSLRLVVLASASALVGTGFLLACDGDDTVVVDTPPDATVPDSSKVNSLDSSVPTSDASDAAAATDAPIIAVPDFPTQVGQALCRSLARCCFGNADLDGGDRVDAGGADAGYKQQACLNDYIKFGFAGSNPPTQVDASAAFVEINQQAANDCLKKIAAMSCGEEQGTEYKDIRDTCFAALSGKSQAGQPCVDSIQCAAGTFCNKADAGNAGPGACAPLRAVGDKCGDGVDPKLDPAYAAEFGEEMCSYRGAGNNGRYCEFFDFVNTDFNAQAGWKCVEARNDSAECANTAWCKSSQCWAPTDDDIAHCVPKTPFFTPALCAAYRF